MTNSYNSTSTFRRLALWLCASALCIAVHAADQPQWGQRYSRNLVSDETSLPDNFDPVTGTNVRWSVALGTQSFATPIVAGGRVLIGANNGVPRDPAIIGDRGVLLCFDEADGHLHWQLLCHKITTSLYWDWPNDGLCSESTVESNRVYIVTNRGELLCLDLNARSASPLPPGEGQGEGPSITPSLHHSITETAALWRFDIIKQCALRQHDSAHSAPLLHGRFLYLNTSLGVGDNHKDIETPNAPSLIAIDKRTGQLVARDDEHIAPNIFHCTWSSPSLGEINGRPLIFFAAGNGIVYAFEALDSARWDTAPYQTFPSTSTVGRAGCPQPAAAATTLKKVWQCDFDPGAPKENIHDYLRNREESPSNFYSMPVFHNGRLYVTGGGDMYWGKRQAWLKCIDAANGTIRWSYALERHTISTPAITGSLVFVGDIGKHLHCVDAETGKPYWKRDLTGEVWASPLVADGKVYIANRKGDFFIFAASKEEKLLSTTKLDSQVAGTVTAANGTLFIATMKRLYAVGLPRAK